MSTNHRITEAQAQVLETMQSAAKAAGPALQDLTKAMQRLRAVAESAGSMISLAVFIFRTEPGRADPWWPLHATSLHGSIGRLHWINSDPAENVWGRVRWSR